MTNESVIKFFRRAPLPVRLKLVALLWVAVVTLGLSGWSILRIFTFDGAVEAEKVTAMLGDSPEVPEYTFTYELKPLSMPLTDRRRIRMAYAQFNLVFDCPTRESVQQMELHRAKLMDVILEVAGQFTIEDFQTPLGYETFKGALKGRYRQLFGQHAPRQIVLRDWLLH